MAETTATSIGIIAKPTHIKIAQVIGISAVGYLTGSSAAITNFFIPSILACRSPQEAAVSWKRMYDRAKLVLPPLSVAVTGIFGWMAWREPSSRTSSFKLFTVAAALPPCMIPYTLACLMPTNKAIMDKEQQYKSVDPSFQPTSGDPPSPMTFTQFIKSTFGKEAPKNEEMTVHQLVDKWGWMHIPRTALHATALVCSAYAICSEDLSFFELF